MNENSSYATGRKAHRRVEQDVYLGVLNEVGVGRCDDIAEHLDVSLATAKRKLDGLAFQRKVQVVGGSGFGTEYAALGWRRS